MLAILAQDYEDYAGIRGKSGLGEIFSSEYSVLTVIEVVWATLVCIISIESEKS